MYVFNLKNNKSFKIGFDVLVDNYEENNITYVNFNLNSNNKKNNDDGQSSSKESDV